MKTLYLHIGLQKTGTSSVQINFMRPNGLFEQAGLDCLQDSIAPKYAHHNAAWDAGNHNRFLPDAPKLSDLIKEAQASSSDRLFVSSEDFSLLGPGRIVELGKALEEFDVRPILCLRNQLTWSESIYAQACKRTYVGGFDAFSESLVKAGKLDLNKIYSNWASVFGHDNMTVLIYENHSDISDAFAQLFGLKIEKTPARKNQSLNERFVNASQAVMKLCLDDALVQDGVTIPASMMDIVTRTMLQAGSHHPQFAGSPVFLPLDQSATYLSRFVVSNTALSEHVRLPNSYLEVTIDRRSPRTPYKMDIEYLIESLFDATAIKAALSEQEGAE